MNPFFFNFFCAIRLKNFENACLLVFIFWKAITFWKISKLSNIIFWFCPNQSTAPRSEEICGRIARRIREEESVKKLPHFVTLCCGILTIETSDSFLRSFCFIGQNGTFSTTEQNGVIFYWLFSKFFWQFDHRFLFSWGASPLPAANQKLFYNCSSPHYVVIPIHQRPDNSPV